MHNKTSSIEYLICGFIAILISAKGYALNYHELEVYGYQTPLKHELELENTTSLSSDQDPGLQNRILRSSLEGSLGLTDRSEASAYVDFTKPVDDHFEETAVRTHLRTRFFEKGEKLVDMGAYFELEFPRNFRQEDVALELRPIFERDFGRWTFVVNPSLELANKAADEDESELASVIDEDENTSRPAKRWVAEWALATSVAFRLSRVLKPHLDWHVGLSETTSLLLPALDWRVARGFNATFAVGFGLTPKTERNLGVIKLEYEFMN